MNINDSIDSDNDNCRNIVINKKDKKGNKKRQITILNVNQNDNQNDNQNNNLNQNQNIGINVLKDNYLKNEDVLEEPISRNASIDVLENTVENTVEKQETLVKDDIINSNDIIQHQFSATDFKTEKIEQPLIFDLTLPFTEHIGQTYLVYAGEDIEKYDIVEIFYVDGILSVRPVSASNNNFYGVAIHSAVKNSKVSVLTSGICRVKLYNNIKLPVMKFFNGKFNIIRDQKNNVIFQEMPININNGDLLIPMGSNDDLICGPKSICTQFNTIESTYMIPFKNIIFNNINSNYSLSINTKVSIGLRFAYVLDPEIKENTILVRI